MMIQSTKRRKSAQQENVALDTLIETTGNSDLEYITTEMKGSLSAFVPLLASWIRGKKLQRALARSLQVTTEIEWASTCKKVGTIGHQRAVETLASFEKNFLSGMPSDALDLGTTTDEEYVVLEREQKRFLNAEP